MQEDSIDWKEIFSKNISIKLSDKIWMMKLLLFLFRLFFKRKLNLKISGADNIPAGACIIAPNHESFLDSLVLSCGLPGKTLENIYFFAKEKNFDFWLAKIFADRGHVVVMDINKNLIQSLQTIAAVLKSGKQIVIFPEGARSRDGKLQPFKKSFAIISKELNVPIIPVVINGTYESLPIGGKIPMKGSVSVRYMPPVLPAGRNEADISNEVYGKIAENIL